VERYTSSRRAASGLALGAAAALGVRVAAAQTPGPGGAAPAAQYIFGYGSLLERESRMGTWPSAEFAAPAVVKGIARGWFDQTDVSSWSPTYLGGVADASAECNGVIFPVSAAEFDSYTQREVGYQPTKIDRAQVTMLDGSAAPPEGDIWYFANTSKRYPSAAHPIVQSYVDVCLNGCLEIEAAYPLAQQAGFAERFIQTTSDWRPPWVNDRMYPWRPFVYVPRASAIDALIQQVLGRELFLQITLK
jgi:hypothetical protein